MNRSVHKDTCRIWDRGVCNCGPINAAPESRDAGGAAPSADSDGGAELPQVDANNSGLAMKLADGREVRARLSVDGGSVCFDLTATNAAHTKIALSFEAIESMRLLANRLAAAQECGEAVAPEAKPEWPKGAFFTDGEGSFYDEQAEPLDHAFAPPAPPAPLPGKPLTKDQIAALLPLIKAEVDTLSDEGRYTFAGWLPIAVRLIEKHHGIAALSAQAAPEYRTGFDEAPSTFNQEDAATADYPPTVSKEQALEGLNRAIERLQMDIDDGSRPDQWSMQAIQENIRIGRRFIEQSGRSGVSADPLPRPLLTDLEIQGLRRQARNDPRCADQHWFILMVRAIESYYGVTGAAAQSQPLVEPTAARVSFLLEQKSVLPHWENLMAYQSEDSARKALPVFRKTTSRDIRIVRQTREVVAVDSVAASPQHQVKKGEPA